MKTIASYTDFITNTKTHDKYFLLLYKSGSEQSECALHNLQNALATESDIQVFVADVVSVRDIHTHYNITSAPALLIFESHNLTSVIKGCQENDFYKALAENAIFRSKQEENASPAKNVTVYSTPTCSWCNTLKTWLRKNNIRFNDIDVSRDSNAAADLVRRSGQQGVPQTEINGQIVVGFDQAKLKRLLEIQ